MLPVTDGGPDHIDNYLYALGGSFNMSISNKFDCFNCYLAGLLKAEKAVAVAVSPRATARAAGQFHHVPLCEQLVVLGFPVNEQSPMLDPKGTGLAKSMQPLLITYDQFGGP